MEEAMNIAESYKAIVSALEAYDKHGGPEDVLDRLHDQRTDLEVEAVRRAKEGTAEVLRTCELILWSHVYDGSRHRQGDRGSDQSFPGPHRPVTSPAPWPRAREIKRPSGRFFFFESSVRRLTRNSGPVGS